jgi:hypothetical protein
MYSSLEAVIIEGYSKLNHDPMIKKRLYWERRVIFISPFPDRGPTLHSGRVYRF